MTAVLQCQIARLALLPDFAEEQWPSMDLIAEMTAAELRDHHADAFAVQLLQPPFRRLLRLPRALGPTAGSVAHNLNRLANRFLRYPHFLRGHAGQYDLFHVCDHSYGQIVHALPADLTGIYCHDLDAFRCLVDPVRDRRPRWFRAMARRLLTGMQKAAIVFYSTEDVRQQIERHGLLDPAKLIGAPFGTAREFSPVCGAEDDADPWGRQMPGPFLLHVGSCIARKRIDVLLDIFASLRRRHRNLRLLQIGGTWTPAQRTQIDRLALGGDAIVQCRGLSRQSVAAAYRRAGAVLLTSEREGFGLPLIEAMACGAPVIASGLAALREVGGDAVVFCPVGDVPAWTAAAERILFDLPGGSRRDRALAQAAKYSWKRFGDIIAEAYQSLLISNAPAEAYGSMPLQSRGLPR